MKKKRISFGCTNHSNGSVLICGGLDQDSNYLDTVELYDVLLDTVRVLPPLPTPRSGCVAVSIKGRNDQDAVYVFGGRNKHYRALNTAEVYKNGQWTTLSPMPSPRCGFTAVAVPQNNKIVLLGGHDGHKLLDSVHILTLHTMQWTMGPALLQPRIGFASLLAHNTLYVMGGRNPYLAPSHQQQQYLNSCCKWDIDTHPTWQPIPSLSTPRYGCSAIATMEGRYLVVAGGYNHLGKPLQTSEIYCVPQQAWSNILPTLTTPRVGAGMAIASHNNNDDNDDSVLVFGGLNGKEFLDTIEEMSMVPKRAHANFSASTTTTTPQCQRQDDEVHDTGVEIHDFLSAPMPLKSTPSLTNKSMGMTETGVAAAAMGENPSPATTGDLLGIGLDPGVATTTSSNGGNTTNTPSSGASMGMPLSNLPPGGAGAAAVGIPLSRLPPGTSVGVPISQLPPGTEMGTPISPTNAVVGPRHDILWSSTNGSLTEEEALEIAIRESIRF